MCECRGESGVSAGHELERERERELARGLLCSPGGKSACVWDEPRAFSNEPINFPSSPGFLLDSHPVVRLTGLCGQAPPPLPPNNLVLEAGQGECESSPQSDAVIPGVKL